MNQNTMLDELIEEFMCELITGAIEDEDVFIIEELRDEFIDFMVRNQEIISTVLYNEPSGKDGQSSN